MSFTDRATLLFETAARRPAAVRAFDAGRLIDIAGSALLLLLAAPFFLAIALAIWAEGDGPVLFKQRRVGRGGGIFACYKFRSMFPDAGERLLDLLARDEAASAEWTTHCKLRRDPRVTAVGGFIRRSSLDELPQLLNVLKGEMSLVGPRPMLETERVRYGRRFAAYAGLRPGLTGLWQVSGRSALRFRRRVAIDVLYARRKSVGLDCRILLATVPAVLSMRGAS